MDRVNSQNFSSAPETILQLFCLCILLIAINETCKAKDDISYASGDSTPNTNITDFQSFLNQLAKICNFKKGGDTETALIILKGPGGPEYNIATNLNASSKLAEAFLSSLLTYAATNPEDLNEKPLQRKILWKILDFNSPRINIYIEKLLKALDGCIHDCIKTGEKETEIMDLLKGLEEKAGFPRDIDTSTDTHRKNNYLSNCESLIKAIEASKNNPARKVIQYHSTRDNAQAYQWRELRHHLGRIHSYRNAAESILRATKEWPDLFQNFTFRPIASSTRTNSPISQIDKVCCSPLDIKVGALTQKGVESFSKEFNEFRPHGLDDKIEVEVRKIPLKTIVHCEIVLRDDLVRRGKTNASDFWNGSKYIATSKPTCRLCHFYFQNAQHDFEVQPSHKNIYLKWRLPDPAENADPQAVKQYEEALRELRDQLYFDVTQALTDKIAVWRKNDSPTYSRGGRSTAYPMSEGSDPRTSSRMGHQRGPVHHGMGSQVGGSVMGSRNSSRMGYRVQGQHRASSRNGASLVESDWDDIDEEIPEEDVDNLP